MNKINQSATHPEPSSTVVSFSEASASDPVSDSTIEYLRERFPDAFAHDPPRLRGAIVAQWVRHGAGGCRCQQGRLHGPYHYLMEMLPGRRLKKRYIRKSKLVYVRALVHCQQNAQARKREERRQWEAAFREIKGHLRDTDKMMSEYVRDNG